MRPVRKFKSGQRWDKSPTRENLNHMVEQGNTSANMRGDEFIGVNRTEGVGVSVFLHLQQLLARIPKPGIKFAKLNADWVQGTNTVTAHPCDHDGANEQDDATLTLYCTWPKDAVPTWVALSDDDVVGYLPFYDSTQSEDRGAIVDTSHAGTKAVPAIILPAAFETEAAEADTWDQSAPPGGKDGVSVRLQTRMAYNHAGDEKLYAYYRTFVYDSSGTLATISAETRIEVDAPDACP